MSKYLYHGQGDFGSQVAAQWPLFGHGYPVYFWADKGLVRYEDGRPDVALGLKYGFLFWQTAAKRVVEISHLVMRSSEDRRWAHERQKLQKFISEMEGVIRQAKEQGGPLDGGTVSREYVRRRPKSVIVPQIVDMD